MSQKVRPFLMFSGHAEEAMNFYVSLFQAAQILEIARYGPGEPGAEGSLKKAVFSIGGQTVMCTDSVAKHDFTFTPAFSLFVDCDSQDDISRLAEALAELRIRPCGPHGQHATGTQCRTRGAQALEIVQHIVGVAREPFRTVVDVEQNRVERRMAGPDQLADIAFVDAHARVRQAIAENLAHRTACPFDHCRHQLGDSDARVRPERSERGPQREAHAQSANQYSRRSSGSDPFARQCGERLLGPAEAAVHQFVATEPDREFRTAPQQA